MMKPPDLWPSVETPEGEKNALTDLYANLWGVYYNVEAWEAALRLLQFADLRPVDIDKDLARRWRFVAANECVHQLHHLRERLALIKGHKVKACPSLSSGIDVRALRSATKLLDDWFPDIDPMRHAIAHSGANEVVPHKHASPDGWLMTRLENSGRYSTHYQGRERSIDITEQSLARLQQVADSYLGGFRAAATTLERQGYADEA